MARVLVVHDDNPTLYVELDDSEEVLGWDGPCSAGCGFSPGEGGTRYNTLNDAVEAAMIHLDRRHGVG